MRITNRRVYHDYNLLEKLETGIALIGPEVKSVKKGKMDLSESFVRIRNREAWLVNAFIHPYPFADNRDYNPRRARKLLLHKRELLRLQQKSKAKGLTIVPVSCYTKANKVKLEIALAKGKKKYEKRAKVKEKDRKREMEKELASFNKA